MFFRFSGIKGESGSGRTFYWSPCTKFSERECHDVLVSMMTFWECKHLSWWNCFLQITLLLNHMLTESLPLQINWVILWLVTSNGRFPAVSKYPCLFHFKWEKKNWLRLTYPGTARDFSCVVSSFGPVFIVTCHSPEHTATHKKKPVVPSLFDAITHHNLALLINSFSWHSCLFGRYADFVLSLKKCSFCKWLGNMCQLQGTAC